MGTLVNNEILSINIHGKDILKGRRMYSSSSSNNNNNNNNKNLTITLDKGYV